MEKKLTKLESQFLRETEYAEAYSYKFDSNKESILIYRLKTSTQNVFHIAEPEFCKMRYVAEAIHAILSQRKGKLIIKHKEGKNQLSLEFTDKDSAWKIFTSLMLIEEMYFATR